MRHGLANVQMGAAVAGSTAAEEWRQRVDWSPEVCLLQVSCTQKL